MIPQIFPIKLLQVLSKFNVIFLKNSGHFLRKVKLHQDFRDGPLMIWGGGGSGRELAMSFFFLTNRLISFFLYFLPTYWWTFFSLTGRSVIFVSRFFSMVRPLDPFLFSNLILVQLSATFKSYRKDIKLKHAQHFHYLTIMLLKFQ